VIATDWSDGIALDPILMPDAIPDWVAHVIERGLAHAGESGFGAVDLVVARADVVMREVLVGPSKTMRGAKLPTARLCNPSAPWPPSQGQRLGFVGTCLAETHSQLCQLSGE
jgi:hypothetical protein